MQYDFLQNKYNTKKLIVKFFKQRIIKNVSTYEIKKDKIKLKIF